jgi:hypothetical protein
MRRAFVLLLGAALAAGCGSSAATVGPSAAFPSPSAAASPAASGGAGISFTVQVDLTGAVEVHGSFIDTWTGYRDPSCLAYVHDEIWHSPGVITGSVKVAGTPVSYDYALPPGDFHGPGTYGRIMNALTIGTVRFVGTESSVTVKEDGSGHGEFSGFLPEGGPATAESGTIAWTCADY